MLEKFFKEERNVKNLKDRSLPVRQLQNHLAETHIKPKEPSLRKSKVKDIRSKHD